MSTHTVHAQAGSQQLTVIAGQHAQLLAVGVVVQTDGARLVRHGRLVEPHHRYGFQGADGQPVPPLAALLAHTLHDHEAHHDDEAEADDHRERQDQMGVDVERQVGVQHENVVVVELVVGEQQAAGQLADEHAGYVDAVVVFGGHDFCRCGPCVDNVCVVSDGLWVCVR